MKKNNWKKPELVILVKGKPEESVLTSNCKKVGTAYTSEVGLTGQSCKNRKTATCGACQGEGGGIS